MRSVVVVLPASMWAMMPMFLQRSNGTCLGTIFSVSSRSAGHQTRVNFVFPTCLPAVVREGLVGLSHAVHVFLLLDRSAAIIGGIQQLVSQLVYHALLAAAAAVGQDPANRQRGAAVGIDLDRDLVVGAADAAGLHFQHRLGVLDGLLEQLDSLVAALLLKLLHCVVEDGLCG